jgi:hypothetical protein
MRMEGADTIIPAPLSAASRVRERPFATMLQNEWNQQVEQLFRSSSGAMDSAQSWGKHMVYEYGKNQ